MRELRARSITQCLGDTEAAAMKRQRNACWLFIAALVYSACIAAVKGEGKQALMR